ncbi:lipase class 3 [Ophiostoma piceae UAMH 11346]|uniref:Lipase class 3 n=1 Tax=Ophiostoma piceae (strain UAMH 11346) TaxID=1262450 RepID=S3CPW7_OPHP1|nr:lipase class 3 [Ophiostoma piceae UAMH 11346]
MKHTLLGLDSSVLKFCIFEFYTLCQVVNKSQPPYDHLLSFLDHPLPPTHSFIACGDSTFQNPHLYYITTHLYPPMGWFAASKKKSTAFLDGSSVPGQVYRPPPLQVQPCGTDPFHHGPLDPSARQHENPRPAFIENGHNGGYTHPPPHTGHYYYPPPIVVNQYYVASPGGPAFPYVPDQKTLGSGTPAAVSKLRLGSVVNLATDLLPMNLPHFFDGEPPSSHTPGSTLVNQGAVLYDQLSSKFDNILTSIDNDRLDSLEADLFSFSPSAGSQAVPAHASTPASGTEPYYGHAASIRALPRAPSKHAPSKTQSVGVLASMRSCNYIAKVDLYANSRLPYNLPPARLYIASYHLLSLAAKYSDRAYQQPQASAESRTHIDADWRAGTKAMVIKSVPMDDVNTIVFAIRGTANFMDWTVNLNTAPASPAGFLDDPGNLCHSGFLSAARKMIRPVALRLRQLLEEDPGRAAYSLLITGHSAGGAVASLLYAHMLATSAEAESELNLLTGCFRRVHCITFGTPPMSLLPLKKPEDRRDLRKSMFFSFINEGDPVVRADKMYVKSLIDLFSSSVPAEYSSKPVWKVPVATLSNAGRLIVLRSGNPRAGLAGKKTVEERLSEGVVAQFTSDEQLRDMIWGDPVCHVMKLYAGRIEALSIAAMMVDT